MKGRQIACGVLFLAGLYTCFVPKTGMAQEKLSSDDAAAMSEKARSQTPIAANDLPSGRSAGGELPHNPNHMGSPYVPLDSWIYPVLERLIALGYIEDAHLGVRPWTRMECATLLEEGSDRADAGQDPDIDQLFGALDDEFRPELETLDGAANLRLQVDSVYTRFTGISGTPLRDGYHFGQTITNDFGRPYGEGFNDITGMSAEAIAGPLAAYVRGEYQHAPAMPSYPSSALAATAAADFTPSLPNGTPQINQFRLLEAVVAVRVNQFQLSFGKQSAWLGPGEAGPLLLSDNAAPFTMVKIDTVSPMNLPGISKLLGSVRAQFFVGQLSGQHWEYCGAPSCAAIANAQLVVGPQISPQPLIHGEKLSFRPTNNLEVGVGVTAMFGGPGLPVTFGNFFRTFYAHSSNAVTNPGKRSTSFDFTYRIPGLRNWLTVYTDSLAVDEISPVGSSRPTLNPGIYLPKVPKVPKLDFRAEFLRVAHTSEFSPGFVYFDLRRYRSGYTNDGSLLGSWIGRAARGGQAWATYWLSPRTNVQLGYRLQSVYKNFIGGGRLVDYSARGEYTLNSRLGLVGLLQYESWRFPVLAPTAQSNLTTSLELTFHPHWQLQKF